MPNAHSDEQNHKAAVTVAHQTTSSHLQHSDCTFFHELHVVKHEEYSAIACLWDSSDPVPHKSL